MIGGISGAQGGSLTHSGLDSTVLVLRCHAFPCVVGRTPDRYLRSFWTMLQGVTPEQGTVAFSWGWSTVALFEERLFALLPPGCRSVSMALPFTIPFTFSELPESSEASEWATCCRNTGHHGVPLAHSLTSDFISLFYHFLPSS